MNHEGDVRWLIAEYCAHPFLYTGWHLYLRESRRYQRRNSDGSWGWIRRPKESCAGDFLKTLGFEITGDGTMNSDGVGKFARRFPLKGKPVGGRPRGGIQVLVGEYGILRLAEKEQ